MLEEQGKHDKAMDYYKKALAITVKALGEDHASVGDICYNMARLLT